jgi:prepilin-type N-terminal cleavage/methylation domain-containing protein
MGMHNRVTRVAFNGHQRGEAGFTLVELAIVLVIIGLLIGGVLKGSEMIQQAKITSTIQQVKGYQAALTTFRDIYNATPGDMRYADRRLPGCNTGCAPFLTDAGNGVVGDPQWQSSWTTQGVATLGNAAGTSYTQETYLFWTHLAVANLIVGVTPRSIDSPMPYEWGITHPAARIGGGFVVGFAGAGASGGAPGNSGRNCGNGNNGGNNGNCRGATAGTTLGIGNVMVLIPSPTGSPVATGSGAQELSPSVAAKIDRKMDDGSPSTGYVLAFGSSSCLTNQSGDPGYDERLTTKICGLLFSNP